jgi:hypothetical protein
MVFALRRPLGHWRRPCTGTLRLHRFPARPLLCVIVIMKTNDFAVPEVYLSCALPQFDWASAIHH